MALPPDRTSLGSPLPGHRRLNLHAQVVRELGLRIVGGAAAPGAILPNEAQLGREFGVSRTVIREGIKSLAAKGLVVSRARVGTQIRAARAWNLLDPDVLSWRYDTMPRTDFFRDLFEIRRVVEPAAAELAAEKGTLEEIQALEAACTAMEQAEPSSNAAIEADIAFHTALLTACRNDLLAQMGSLIGVGLSTSFRISTRFYPLSLPYHRPVAAAIMARRPLAARRRMLDLLTRTYTAVERELLSGPPAGRRGETSTLTRIRNRGNR